MEVLPLENGGLRFLEMPSAFFEQLSMLSEICDPDGDPTILARLYPQPLDPEEPEEEQEALEADWADFVRPEMEASYDLSLLTVLNDLAEAKVLEETEEETFYSLEIPEDHLHPWFQVLNRARIVLALKHRLPISEYPADGDESFTLQRLLASHLSDSFAEILEVFLHQMNRE